VADLNGERGQILLIAAFALAVIFIALALVVNGAIFTENLASQGEASGGNAVLELRSEVTRALGEVVEEANRNAADPENRFTATDLDALEGQLVKYTSLTGVDVRLDSPTVTTTGHYMADREKSDNELDSESGEENWRLASGVDDVRAMEFYVRGEVDGISGDTFTVNVTHRVHGGGSGEPVFLLKIGDDGGNPAVRVVPPSSPAETCSLPGRDWPLHVDVMDAQFGGKYCEALDAVDFGQGVSPGYNLYFNHTGEIDANFSLVTKSPPGSPIDSNFDASDPGDPQVRSGDVIYAAEVDLHVRTAAIEYEDTVRIAPKEDD